MSHHAEDMGPAQLDGLELHMITDAPQKVLGNQSFPLKAVTWPDMCAAYRDKVQVKESFTVPALLELLHDGAQFDFVYMDASHTRSDTLLDAVLMWRMVAAGAVVVFDDYQWSHHPR